MTNDQLSNDVKTEVAACDADHAGAEFSTSAKSQGPSTAAIISIILSVVQILGVSIGVLAATVEIETIPVFGPIFSVTGLALAIVARRDVNLPRRLFGLSALAVTVLCAMLIFFNQWSPKDAERPIGTLLIVYESLFLPIGLVGLYRVIATLSRPVGQPRSQFSLRSLFFVVLAAGIGLAVARPAYNANDWGRTAIAAGIISLVPVAILLMCIVAHRDTHPKPPRPDAG